MESLLQSLFTLVLVHKYLAIFLMACFGAIGFPIPANTIVTASAFFALQGYFDLFWVFLASFIGNYVGDLVGYLPAQRYGTRIFIRLGLRKLIEANSVVRLEQKIRRYPMSTIIASRLFSALTPVANILAGIAHIRLSTFLIGGFIGVFLQVTLACATGVLFGDQWQEIQSTSRNIFGIIFLITLFCLFFWKQKRTRVKH